MVTQITLGSFSQQNGRTVVTGGQSGFDTTAIVDSLVTARRLPAVALEDRIKTNDSRTTALNSLKDILTRFRDASDVLRNPPGINNATQNIFAYRTANLSSNTTVSANNYLAVTVEPGANTQSINISNIDSLARESKQNTGDFILPSADTAVVGATANPGFFTAGTVSLRNVTGGAPVDITLAAGDSLNTVASKFNALRDQTGIQATVVRVSSGSSTSTFQIVFTATRTGTTYGFDLNDPATVLSDPSGVLSSANIPAPTQTARNARFTLDNVVVERETNAINDVISGITFNLKQPTPIGTDLQLNIVPDTTIVKNAITQFVDVYNEFRLFASTQTEFGNDGRPKDTAVLNNNSSLRSIIARIGSEITTVVSGLANGDPQRLADIGLSFQDFQGDDENPFTRNILQINDERLSSALSSDFTGVTSLFQFQLQSNNPNLVNFRRSNNIGINHFTLAIDRTNNTYNATYTDAQGTTQTVALDGTPVPGGGAGVSLSGKAGTVLDGLQLIYGVAGDANINVSFTQGLGDRLFNTTNDLLNTSSGLIQQELTSIQDNNTRFQADIDRIDAQITRYRDQILQQYAALESALSRSNQLLQALDAQQQARNNT